MTLGRESWAQLLLLGVVSLSIGGFFLDRSEPFALKLVYALLVAVVAGIGVGMFYHFGLRAARL